MRAPPESFRPMTGAPTRIASVHDLDDLGGVGLRQRAAEHREVLGEDEHQPAFDASVAGDEAVAVILLLVHAEVGAAMGDELVGLFEGAFVEQELDALARRHLALLVLACAAFFASAGFGQRVAALQFGQLLFQVHGRDYKQRVPLNSRCSALGGSPSSVTDALAECSCRLSMDFSGEVLPAAGLQDFGLAVGRTSFICLPRVISPMRVTGTPAICLRDAAIAEER